MKKIQLSKTSKKYKDKFAIIDDDVFEEVNRFNWTYKTGHGREYAIRKDYSNRKRKCIHLHRFIYELKNGEIPEGYFIDHIDGNGLNNQIENLRLATSQENGWNHSTNILNTTGFIGKWTWQDKRIENKFYTKWLAYITKDGKRYQKRFPFTNDGFEQAKEWRMKKEKELFGKFAPNRDK